MRISIGPALGIALVAAILAATLFDLALVLKTPFALMKAENAY